MEDYLLDNYGVCTKGKTDADCDCLKPGARWLGRLCAHWQPSGATTLAQLKEAQATVKEALDEAGDHKQ